MFRPLLLQVLQHGPPWYQRTLRLVQILVVVVLVLSAALMYLWYRDAARANRSVVDVSVPEREVSDEELVERVIGSAGGKLTQQQLVDQTEWTEAKVSRVTSRLADEGTIEKIRVGRQNIIRLKDGGRDARLEDGDRGTTLEERDEKGE